MDEDKITFNAKTSTWKSLSSKYSHIINLQPWEWVKESNLFAIMPPKAKEPIFVHFPKNNEKDLNFIVLVLDLESEALFQAVRSGHPNRDILIHEINSIHIYTKPLTTLNPHERIVANVAKFPETSPIANKNIAPTYLRFLKGFTPQILQGTDVELACEILNQTLGILLRAETEISLIERTKPMDLYVRAYNPTQNTWEDTRKNIIIPPEFTPPKTLNIPKNLVDDALALPEKYETIEMGISVIPYLGLLDENLIKRLNGSPLPLGYYLAVCDRTCPDITKSSIGNCIFYPGEATSTVWTSIPEALLRLFLNLKGRPKEIVVSSHRMVTSLRILQAVLPFKLTFHNNLERFNAAKQATERQVNDFIKNHNNKGPNND